jgi:LacI family transcriptional regulator
MKIAEIAAKTGVSIGTVDRVLHNRGRVSPETKTKIEKVIKESGYKPNPLAQNLKKGTPFKIGVLLPKLGSESGYWKQVIEGMKQAEEELKPFCVTLVMKEFDRSIPGDCLATGKQLVKSGPNALALAPVMQEEALQVIEINKNLPYAIFDSSLPGSSPVTTNLQDAYRAGFTAGRLMSLLAPQAHLLTCLQMYANACNLKERAEGFCDFFKQFNPTVKIFNCIFAHDLGLEDFKGYINDVLEKQGVPDGIFVTNDAVWRLEEEIEKLQLPSRPVIIGFDLMEKNKTALEQGKIDALISQQPKRQGYLTIKELFRALVMHQEETVPTVSIPIEILLKENLPEQTDSKEPVILEG